MNKSVLNRVIEVMVRGFISLRQFFKNNYRNYYDDRSWWEEVGSERNSNNR